MAITPKPQKISDPSVDIDALINKGGSVATSTPPQETAPTEHPGEVIQKVQLRVPTDILDKVDAQIKNKQNRMSRHSWILEAIVEKTKRDA